MNGNTRQSFKSAREHDKAHGGEAVNGGSRMTFSYAGLIGARYLEANSSAES
jgi:hypothetical protein